MSDRTVKAYRNRVSGRVFEPTAVLAKLKNKMDLEELYTLPAELGGAKSAKENAKTRRERALDAQAED